MLKFPVLIQHVYTANCPIRRLCAAVTFELIRGSHPEFPANRHRGLWHSINNSCTASLVLTSNQILEELHEYAQGTVTRSSESRMNSNKFLYHFLWDLNVQKGLLPTFKSIYLGAMTPSESEYLQDLMEFHGLILMHDSFLKCAFKSGRFMDYVGIFNQRRRLFLNNIDDLAQFELGFMLKLFEHKWVDFEKLYIERRTADYAPDANTAYDRFLKSLMTSYRFAAQNGTRQILRKRLVQNNALFAVEATLTWGDLDLKLWALLYSFLMGFCMFFIWYGIRDTS